MPLVYKALSEMQLINMLILLKHKKQVTHLSGTIEIQQTLKRTIEARNLIEEQILILKALLNIEDTHFQGIIFKEPAKKYFSSKQIDAIWSSTPLSKRNNRDLPVPIQYFRQKPMKDRAPAVLMRILGTIGYQGKPHLMCTDDEGQNRQLTISIHQIK
ncbi:hypothetical protein IT408_03660 [Candidatus Uhrbacteria bacterium]|nr:hypothetical protein [Candidatus Uhrbacteria bacterium]